MSERSVSVVIPVYNSQDILPLLLRRLHPALQGLGEAFEIILVNDGSRDGSWQTVAALCPEYPEVRGVDLTRNFGQHNSLLCGIRMARHAIIVTMDDDLQHPPEEIPVLLAKLAEGHDVVYGRPRLQRHGWWRNGASAFTKLALRHAMGVSTASEVSAFRAFRTRLREGFDGFRSPLVSIDVLLSWATTRFAAVSVCHEPRRIGRSNYSLSKLFVHALNLTVGFTTAPLRFATLLGLFTTLLGLGVLSLVVGRYFIQGSVAPGFPFLASIVAIFSGVQLFALGIIGEYLARVHLRTMERPAYIVRGTTCEPT